MYGAYSLVRNLMGDNEQVAFRNAERLISAERTLGIFHEEAIQDLFDHGWLLQPLNSFYGIAHFTLTAGLMVWLYHRRSTYHRYRNALIVTTGLALVGYLSFPLAPPRMFPEYGFFDALDIYGSPWTYENSAVGSISNQFAAMPSLHVGWALWCSWVIWKEAPYRWLRPIAVGYSTLVVLTIVVTGNHYFLDAVGGLAVLLIGVLATHLLHVRSQARAGLVAEQGLEAVVAAVDGDDVSGVVAAGPRREVHGEAAEVLG